MSITLKTHKMLWGRSGNRCALPTCRRILVEDETETDDASIVGDEAHIIAKENDGPRGISTLTPEERDKFDNLILLCKVHHKQIDDQHKKYTVELLQKIKSEHIEWVNTNLNPDIRKQHDEEMYSSYIDKWIIMADISNWTIWISNIFDSGEPRIKVKRFELLQNLNEYILSRVWPKRYDKIEFALNNFRLILNDFLKVFSMYKIQTGSDESPWFDTVNFYREARNEEIYKRQLDAFNFHVDLVLDLACELTRSANYVCDQIREYLSRSFRIAEGVLLISNGPDMNLSYTTVRLEYPSNNIEDIKYLGLEKFMTTRSTREYFFGEGIRKNYLPRNLDI